MLKLACMPLGFFITSIAIAAVNIPNVQNNSWDAQNMQDSALLKTGLQELEDDITDAQQHEQLPLSAEAQHEAKVWKLSPEEEKRYLKLMQNRSALYYKDLRMTPLDILGLNAQSNSERQHFAELAAKLEAIKVAQNLAWNNAFHEAYNKLFEGIPVVGDFDPTPFSPLHYKPLRLSAGESLYLFIRSDDAIKTVLMILVEALQETPNTQLNLLFLGMNEEAIQNWANRHDIPRAMVRGKRITLNQGEIPYQALPLKKKASPLLLLAKNGASSLVDMGRF